MNPFPLQWKHQVLTKNHQGILMPAPPPRFRFIYLFLTVLGLHCFTGFSLIVVSERCSLVAVRGLPIAVASLVGEYVL